MFHQIKKSSIFTQNSNLNAIIFSNFLSGIASVMIFSVLSLYMHEELKLSYKDIGAIEGGVILFSFIAKIVSGYLSDRYKKRKIFIILGMILGIIIKPIFIFAQSFLSIFFAKGIDRLAKGIRAAPTDALIADSVHKSLYEKSYALRCGLYALGFTIGGLTSSYLMKKYDNNYQLVFVVSLVPSLMATLISIVFIEDCFKHNEQKEIEKKSHLMSLYNQNIFHSIKQRTKELPQTFWHLMVITFILMLGRFSEAFIHFRGRDYGIAISSIPLMMILYNLSESCSALWMSSQSKNEYDKYHLLKGILFLSFANFMLLPFSYSYSVLISICCAGIHMGVTQSLIGAMIARDAPAHLRGTAFSVFYLVSGIAVPLGNYFAGSCAQWSQKNGLGTSGAFMWGLIATIAAAFMCYIYNQKEKKEKSHKSSHFFS
ncbi:MAG: hypothetical protein C0432_01245 [Candidatus Puniceispirillum sp.]|nr:hypothetical protein [Candidatus Pelagibacter sp.]MBA4282907.1 hypothetical protein [Candidatus Puniceispirillum sp.]